jgi:hypothetical protein
MKKQNWENDSIQFPRLIAELEAAGGLQYDKLLGELSESMDLTVNEISEIVDRAQKAWETIKEKTVPAKDPGLPNTNCLAGMQCPKCNSAGPFIIVARSEFTMFDDGSDGHTDIEWDSDSSCWCKECCFTGSVEDFRHRPYRVLLTVKKTYMVTVEANSSRHAGEKTSELFDNTDPGESDCTARVVAISDSVRFTEEDPKDG